jgi:hypothetical protein
MAMTLGMFFYNVSCNLIMLQSAVYEYINFDASNIIIGFITDRVIFRKARMEYYMEKDQLRDHTIFFSSIFKN